MALAFMHLTLSGVHGPIHRDPPDLQTVRTKFPGVIGISELNLESGMRKLWTDIWLFNEYDAAGIVALRRQLDVGVGLHGTLTVTGTLAETFEQCTFEGFQQDEGLGPIPDVAGSLGTTGKFWIAGRLTWTQHRVSLDG